MFWPLCSVQTCPSSVTKVAVGQNLLSSRSWSSLATEACGDSVPLIHIDCVHWTHHVMLCSSWFLNLCWQMFSRLSVPFSSGVWSLEGGNSSVHCFFGLCVCVWSESCPLTSSLNPCRVVEVIIIIINIIIYYLELSVGMLSLQTSEPVTNLLSVDILASMWCFLIQGFLFLIKYI